MTARLSTVFFALLCLVGAVSAIGLTIHEALRTPAVAVHVERTARAGLTTTVTLTVHNTTAQARCATVRIAARDRDGKDLGTATAAPDLRLPAHAARTISARVTLTARQYAEQLHAFFGSSQPCADAERGT